MIFYILKKLGIFPALVSRFNVSAKTDRYASLTLCSLIPISLYEICLTFILNKTFVFGLSLCNTFTNWRKLLLILSQPWCQNSKVSVKTGPICRDNLIWLIGL